MYIHICDRLSFCEQGMKQKMLFTIILLEKLTETYPNLDKYTLGETKLQLYKTMMKIHTKE